MDTAEVPEQARSYAEAARRAVDAGFDGVELHGANGYLIAHFLSSTANLRTDAYGGSITNRIRYAVQTVFMTVEAVGGHRTGLRLSPGAGIWGAEDTEHVASRGLEQCLEGRRVLVRPRLTAVAHYWPSPRTVEIWRGGVRQSRAY
ncbi:hypothetical protein [Streptosporangium sp. NPDC050284]|uniref:oxidoreductase n=1 Tax=Streptosporangium sp. NPDC050284 TaxID=3366193 RepID=UPI0037BDAA76